MSTLAIVLIFLFVIFLPLIALFSGFAWFIFKNAMRIILIVLLIAAGFFVYKSFKEDTGLTASQAITYCAYHNKYTDIDSIPYTTDTAGTFIFKQDTSKLNK